MASRFVKHDDSRKARVHRTRALHVHARAWRGFSLIELILVVAIMVIVSAIAVPRYASAVALSRADSAARKIATDLAYARSLAMTSSKPQAVVFSVATGTYQLSGQLDPVRRTMAYQVDVSAEPYKSKLVSATFGSTATVTFSIYGLPDNAGTVVVGSGSVQRTITLDDTTGRCAIQ